MSELGQIHADCVYGEPCVVHQEETCIAQNPEYADA